MTRIKTLNSKVMCVINGLGIIRCEEKKVDYDGNVYGQNHVWYDVCLDNGEGDIIESFKKLADAKKFARGYRY